MLDCTLQATIQSSAVDAVGRYARSELAHMLYVLVMCWKSSAVPPTTPLPVAAIASGSCANPHERTDVSALCWPPLQGLHLHPGGGCSVLQVLQLLPVKAA
jgi:hypothetical protein